MSALKYTLFFLLAGFLVISCVQPPDYPDEPAIAYSGVNKDTIAQGNGGALPDTLAVFFEFQDGDGDLGLETDSFDIFLTDSRDGFVNYFKLPVIPVQGTGNGISGEVTLRIPNTPFNICCTFPDGSTACQPNPNYPTDTLSYTVQIRDRAGHYSNKVQTEVIHILCQ